MNPSSLHAQLQSSGAVRLTFVSTEQGDTFERTFYCPCAPASSCGLQWRGCPRGEGLDAASRSGSSRRRENIAYGLAQIPPDSEIKAALEKAMAWSFVDAKPDKLLTASKRVMSWLDSAFGAPGRAALLTGS